MYRRHIPPIPGVEAFFFKLTEVPFRKPEDLLVLDLKLRDDGFLLLRPSSSEENLVQLPGHVEVEWRVIQAQVNSRLESWVDSTDAISGQEENPGVVLEAAQEYTSNRVAPQVGLVSFGEKYIRLVKEEHAAPFVGQAKIMMQIFLDFHGRLTDVSAGNGEERPLCLVGDALGCRCLSHAWNT